MSVNLNLHNILGLTESDDVAPSTELMMCDWAISADSTLNIIKSLMRLVFHTQIHFL